MAAPPPLRRLMLDRSYSARRGLDSKSTTMVTIICVFVTR